MRWPNTPLTTMSTPIRPSRTIRPRIPCARQTTLTLTHTTSRELIHHPMSAMRGVIHFCRKMTNFSCDFNVFRTTKETCSGTKSTNACLGTRLSVSETLTQGKRIDDIPGGKIVVPAGVQHLVGSGAASTCIQKYPVEILGAAKTFIEVYCF
jgi:hypothetical protein